MCDQIAWISLIIPACQMMTEWVKLVETDRLIIKQFFFWFQKSTDIKHEIVMLLLSVQVCGCRERERDGEKKGERERECYSSPGGTVSPPLQHQQPAPCGPKHTHTHTHTRSSCRRCWWQTLIWCFISWHKRFLPSRVHTPSCSSENPEHRCPFTADRNVTRNQHLWVEKVTAVMQTWLQTCHDMFRHFNFLFFFTKKKLLFFCFKMKTSDAKAFKCHLKFFSKMSIFLRLLCLCSVISL